MRDTRTIRPLGVLLICIVVAWGTLVPSFALSSSNLFEQFSQADSLQKKKVVLERLLTLEPGSADGHFAKGWLLDFEQRFDDAVIEYQEAIRIKHDFSEAHNGLGNVYLNLKKIDQAMAEYLAAVVINPGYIEARLNIAMLHYKKNRLDQAASAYLAVIQINPKHAAAHNNLGFIYYQKGELAKAIRTYRKALKINPSLPEAHYNLAAAWEEFGHPVEALKEYRIFLSLAKEDYPAQAEEARDRIGHLDIEIFRLRP